MPDIKRRLPKEYDALWCHKCGEYRLLTSSGFVCPCGVKLLSIRELSVWRMMCPLLISETPADVAVQAFRAMSLKEIECHE